MPSGDRSANPARVPGRSGLPRVHLSVLSARNRSGVESLATPSGITRAATSVVSCRSSISGHRSSSSKHTRGQSRETGSLSRLFSSVETTAKCISLGPAHCRESLSYSVRRSATTFQKSISHISESQAGSGIRTRSDLSLEEGGHRGGPSSRQRVRVLQPVLNCPIGTVLEFLQARFSAGLTHSTLRVYVLAIAAYHAPMCGQSVGKDPLITRFLRGVMRLRPRVRSRV